MEVKELRRVGINMKNRLSIVSLAKDLNPVGQIGETAFIHTG